MESVTAIALFVATSAQLQPMLDRPVPKFRTGRMFQSAMKAKFDQAEWKDVPAAEMLRDLSHSKLNFSVILDRRIDPTKKLTVKVNSVTLKEVLEKIAKAAGGKAAILTDVVYIGPSDAADALPGLIKKRAAELKAVTKTLPFAQAVKLVKRRTTHWNDLDTPRDIVTQLGKDFGCRIDGLDKLPHDLWRTATIPQARRGQTLSLVLIQFDLTFRYRDKGKAIEIVRIPKAAKAKSP